MSFFGAEVWRISCNRLAIHIPSTHTIIPSHLHMVVKSAIQYPLLGRNGVGRVIQIYLMVSQAWSSPSVDSLFTFPFSSFLPSEVLNLPDSLLHGIEEIHTRAFLYDLLFVRTLQGKGTGPSSVGVIYSDTLILPAYRSFSPGTQGNP